MQSSVWVFLGKINWPQVRQTAQSKTNDHETLDFKPTPLPLIPHFGDESSALRLPDMLRFNNPGQEANAPRGMNPMPLFPLSTSSRKFCRLFGMLGRGQ